MPFEFQKTKIEGVWIISPKVFGDNRGYFRETYQKDLFDSAGLNYRFVQVNESKSHQGVLRGLHFQTRKPQAKLVRVVEGEVFDVAVDLRQNSRTYGEYVGVILNSKNKKRFRIPRGFAHGFLVLSKMATFEYQVDDVYDPGYEGGIKYNDSDINIKWPDCGCPIELSEKDKQHPSLEESKAKFFVKGGTIMFEKNR